MLLSPQPMLPYDEGLQVACSRASDSRASGSGAEWQRVVWQQVIWQQGGVAVGRVAEGGEGRQACAGLGADCRT